MRYLNVLKENSAKSVVAIKMLIVALPLSIIDHFVAVGILEDFLT